MIGVCISSVIYDVKTRAIKYRCWCTTFSSVCYCLLNLLAYAPRTAHAHTHSPPTFPPFSAAEGSGEPIGVTFNPYDKASFITLSRDRRTVTSLKGYRMVKSTAGASSGAIFYEFAVLPESKPTAHFR